MTTQKTGHYAEKPDDRITSLSNGQNTASNLIKTFEYELDLIAKDEYYALPLNITEEDRKLGSTHLGAMAMAHLENHLKDIIAIGYTDVLLLFLIQGAEAKNKLNELREALNKIEALK
ncbi:MAG: hypothetical protein QXO24_03285 [Candidatus Micrarchaeaceae archaeon]